MDGRDSTRRLWPCLARELVAAGQQASLLLRCSASQGGSWQGLPAVPLTTGAVRVGVLLLDGARSLCPTPTGLRCWCALVESTGSTAKRANRRESRYCTSCLPRKIMSFECPRQGLFRPQICRFTSGSTRTGRCRLALSCARFRIQGLVSRSTLLKTGCASLAVRKRPRRAYAP